MFWFLKSIERSTLPALQMLFPMMLLGPIPYVSWLPRMAVSFLHFAFRQRCLIPFSLVPDFCTKYINPCMNPTTHALWAKQKMGRYFLLEVITQSSRRATRAHLSILRSVATPCLRRAASLRAVRRRRHVEWPTTSVRDHVSMISAAPP